MTKSTITREQLEEWVAQFDEDGGCDATDRQLEALIRQSLAAMDSEPAAPVAEIVSIYGDPEAFGEREIRPLVGIQQMPYGTKLYRHAQPAPVVHGEVARAIEELKRTLVDCNRYNYCSDAVARVEVACRATMLQAGNHPAQSDCCPEQNSVNPAQGGNSLVIPDEMTSEQAYEIGYYYGDPVDVFARGANWMRQHIIDSTLAVAPQLPGSDPATVPGKWIPVSERLPEDSGRYWCYVEEQNDLGKSHYQWNCSWNGDRWWVESEGGGIVTHWMPLPAAPQEVNRE